MVRRFLERIAQPVRGLHQAAYLLAFFTLASQLLALLRDRTFAHAFGASQVLDLYYAAFKVPDLVFALVSSLVSAYILIPRITGASQEEASEFLSEALTFLAIGGGVICAALAIEAPHLLFAIYPEFAHSPYRAEFILLARLLLIQPILLGISGVLGSVTQVERQFFLFSLAPVLYNLGIIFGTVFLYPRYGLPGIGYGVLAGSVAYVATNLPSLATAHIRIRLSWPRWRTMLPVVRDSIPRSLALGMDSFTLLFLTALAARLSQGSVSVFTLAGNLENVPLALIGGSYAVAAFPALSKHASDNREEFCRVLSSSARHIILWSMVFLGLVVTLRAYIVRAILGSGAFDWNATRLTAALLALFVVGLAAQGLVLLFNRALYAVKQSWRPFAYQLGAAVFTALVALFLVSPAAAPFASWLAEILRVGSVSGALVLTLAFAATLGELFLAVWSTIALRSIAPGLARSLMRPLFDGFAAAVIGGAACYGALTLLGGIAPLSGLTVVLTDGVIGGITGLVVAIGVLWLLRNPEFFDIAAALHRLSLRYLAPSAPESYTSVQ